MIELSKLWSVFRRGFIGYIGAKLVVLPVFCYLGIAEMVDRGLVTSGFWNFVSVGLLVATPFWSAYWAREVLCSPGFERYRGELMR